MTVEEVLRKNRENLSPNSVKTYASSIRSVYGKMDGKEGASGEEMRDFFKENVEKTLSFLKDKPIGTRKSLLSALLILTEGSGIENKYREAMMKDAKSYNNEQREQTKTEKQEENWISQDEVLRIYRLSQRETQKLRKKTELTKPELRKLMNYVILSLYVLIPPRRILDYTVFKVRNIDKTKDNFMEKGKFIFNRYKTDNKYGQQVVKIPRSLQNIIKMWETKHDNDYLLFNEDGKPLTPPRMTTRLNTIFGKKISVNMLRHIYLTDKLKDIPALKELDELADDMGHSVDQQMLYAKK